MKHKTIDGKPIQMSVSGFNEYTTTESSVGTNPPVPLVSASELLNLLTRIRTQLQNKELERLLISLREHINADNPHQTELSDFTEKVIDIFYMHYFSLGGTLSLEEYTISLFNMLRIATVEEIREPSTDPLLLISIGGAREFINEHEIDPNAHQALFDRLLPGEPITYIPAYALQASVGISSELTQYLVSVLDDTDAEPEMEVLPYSFINPAGYVEYAPLGELPITKYKGKSTIPCFEYRENLLVDSEGLSLLDTESVIKTEAALVNPAKGDTAIAMTAGLDIFAVEHSFILKEVELEYRKPKTFSVFAKAGSCRYLAISYVDMVDSSIITRGVYDLQTRSCVTLNPLTRYSSNIDVLGNGWSRCEFTMFHEIGQTSDIKLTFFKEAELNELENTTFIFRGNNEECGYLWGIQLEEGFEASPYIPTTDKPGYREAISINIELGEEFTRSYHNSLSVEMMPPKITHYSDPSRPIAVLKDTTGASMITLNKQFDNQIKFMVFDYTGSPSIRFYPILGDRVTTTTTVSITDDRIFYQVNEIGDDSVAADYNTMLTVHLGHDNFGNFLNGYICSTLLYDKGLSYPEILFLHGDLQDES